MKFESKFGIGEICGYNENAFRGTKKMDDTLVKIVAVNFDIDGHVSYVIEQSGGLFGIQRIQSSETMLNGDPDFDQEAGCYPPEIDDE